MTIGWSELWRELGIRVQVGQFPFRDGVVTIEQMDINTAEQLGDPWVNLLGIGPANGGVNYQVQTFAER